MTRHYLRGAGWDQRLQSNADNSFDAIRLVLAILVVVGHSYYMPFNSLEHEPLYTFSGGQTDFGTLAVNFFFVLSGFLITRSWLLTRKPTRYLQKRIARICPGFFAASVLTIVIAAVSSGDLLTFFSTINARATVLQILSLNRSGPFPPMGIIDGTLWTIKYEFDCYLLVALLGICGLLTRATAAFVFATFALSYALQSRGYLAVPSIDHGVAALLVSNPIYWPRFFSYFFAGAAFYLWRAAIPKSGLLTVAALVAVMLALRYGAAEPILILAGTYFIFSIALSTAAVPRFGGKRIDLSYGIYLFGFPIQQLIIGWSSGSASPIWLFLTSFPAICCVAYLSWKSIEAPCLRWGWPTWPEMRLRTSSLLARLATPRRSSPDNVPSRSPGPPDPIRSSPLPKAGRSIGSNPLI
jgi:peptidoglycan/LPS O-acetylase OafA/YrhL